jgi:hypothetical protein
LDATALETTLNGVYPQLSTTDTFAKQIFFDNGVYADMSLGSGFAATVGVGTNGSIGNYGSSDTGYGVQGESTSGQGVVGQVDTPAAGSEGVLGYTNKAFSNNYQMLAPEVAVGVWGDTSGNFSSGSTFDPVGVAGTADNGYGGIFFNNSAILAAVDIFNTTGTGATIASAGTGDGVDVVAKAGDGVNAFVNAPSNFQAGVVGVAASHSETGTLVNLYSGVWGDTGTNSNKLASGNYAVGLLGTADDSTAGQFMNNSSDFATLFVHNYGSGGIGTAVNGTPALFNTFMASSAVGTCGINDGSMSCTGPLKSLTSAGGSRTVETYAMQSPENWMEDFGSGSLVDGHATVSIDPAFAAVVAGDARYHVFITPNGDSVGHLYVAVKTSSGFEVRESGGGTSSLSFDYRIVAKRAGYEGQRMVDVTEALTRQMARANVTTSRPVEQALPAPRRSGVVERALQSPHRILVPKPSPKLVAPQATAAPAKPVASK